MDRSLDALGVRQHAVAQRQRDDAAALQRTVAGGERLPVNHGTLRDTFRREIVRHSLHEFIFGPRQVGQSIDGVEDARVELAGEMREQFMAHAVSREADVLVRFVAAIGEIARVQIRDHVAPADFEQRPDHAHAVAHGLGGNARQPAGRCAADDPHQDGLGLVVCVVARDDGGASADPRGLREERVAPLAGVFLERHGGVGRALGDVLGVQVKRHAERPGKRLDEPGVIRTGAGSRQVVEMGDLGAEAGLDDEIKQRDGIGSAGDGDDQGIGGGGDAECPQRVTDAVAKLTARISHGANLREPGKGSGSGAGIRTPDTRIMIPLL